MRSKSSVLAETALLVIAAAAAVFWIIPVQTSGEGLGLSPGFLPKLCAVVIGGLVLFDGLSRLLRERRPPAYPVGWRPAARLGALSLAGAGVLSFLGSAAAALLVLPAGMLLLGERRPLLIGGVTAAGTLALLLAAR